MCSFQLSDVSRMRPRYFRVHVNVAVSPSSSYDELDKVKEWLAINKLSLKACAQRFRYALFAFIHIL